MNRISLRKYTHAVLEAWNSRFTIKGNLICDSCVTVFGSSRSVCGACGVDFHSLGCEFDKETEEWSTYTNLLAYSELLEIGLEI